MRRTPSARMQQKPSLAQDMVRRKRIGYISARCAGAIVTAIKSRVDLLMHSLRKVPTITCNGRRGVTGFYARVFSRPLSFPRSLIPPKQVSRNAERSSQIAATWLAIDEKLQLNIIGLQRLCAGVAYLTSVAVLHLPTQRRAASQNGLVGESYVRDEVPASHRILSIVS